ncbi:HTH domain-containing protein [Tautonia sociabilis]|uniref:HTH domain-containing protein n=1 Tax=Tautonia sociabilis TaxID=2080755 RepID=A0A432MR97_9BACT|nr:HTH domain-containing protein [Tautonia sociabilis]RUL89458.1 HTH domain-containing protein [Tautonia sociabilis]
MRYERALAVTNRLENLLDLIREGSYSTPAIAAKLQVCDQTIYRDVLFLKRRGYKIRSRRLSSRWAYELLGEPEAGRLGKGEDGP